MCLIDYRQQMTLRKNEELMKAIDSENGSHIIININKVYMSPDIA